MFIEVLFIIYKTWKQSDVLQVAKWVNKMQNIQTVEYHSALKRNELSIKPHEDMEET